jgi:hypothetical protein
MPMNRDRYPGNWDEIALDIKAAANWICVECGRPCRHPGELANEFANRIKAHHPMWSMDLADEEQQGEVMVLIPKIGRFTLTVAHLDHTPENCDADNLRAWCSVCHCRNDLRAIPQKRMLKREFDGQLSFV